MARKESPSWVQELRQEVREAEGIKDLVDSTSGMSRPPASENGHPGGSTSGWSVQEAEFFKELSVKLAWAVGSTWKWRYGSRTTIRGWANRTSARLLVWKRKQDKT